MIAGRKLLLADDSIAIQKVIDLTFTDEGMEVTTVGDGDDAIEKLEQLTPDVVLADVFMPGVDGYGLCQYIKKDARFSQVPVMLLVGSFEPFDQAEAERVGADDVVTKPFQSIRQLVSRVGSLLREDSDRSGSSPGLSTLGLDREETAPLPEPIPEPSEHANVRVFVEAPIMNEDEAPETEHACPPNLELQTADTQKLDRAEMEDEITELEASEQDTIEVEPVAASATPVSQTAEVDFDETVLDLGDVDSFAAANEDFVLDLDVETVQIEELPYEVTEDLAVAPEAVFEEPRIEEVQPEMLAVEVEPAVEVSEDIVAPEVEPAQASGETGQADLRAMSPEAIEAISRRVVEQLSDKVIREIAWEVVPDLSELLIKRKLEEQK